MRRAALAGLLTALAACESPTFDLGQSCRQACAPRLVKRCGWDGYRHDIAIECDDSRVLGGGQ